MPSTFMFGGTPYQYETEADAGIALAKGERWWGTRIRYRPGVRGKWFSTIVRDLHPMDYVAVDAALRAILERHEGR